MIAQRSLQRTFARRKKAMKPVTVSYQWHCASVSASLLPSGRSLGGPFPAGENL
jgi:hypothetical protein